MAKDIITVDGEDKVVREDTAKSYRGVIWALTVVLIFIVVAVVLFLGLFAKKAGDGSISSPANIENTTRR